MIHIHYGTLFRFEENEIMNFAGKWTELKRIILSEVTQMHKVKCCKFSLIGNSQLQSSDVSTYPGVTSETRKLKQSLPGYRV